MPGFAKAQRKSAVINTVQLKVDIVNDVYMEYLVIVSGDWHTVHNFVSCQNHCTTDGNRVKCNKFHS